jgi:hypothetical protein
MRLSIRQVTPELESVLVATMMSLRFPLLIKDLEFQKNLKVGFLSASIGSIQLGPVTPAALDLVWQL